MYISHGGSTVTKSVTAQRVLSNVLWYAICKRLRAAASAHHATPMMQQYACLHDVLFVCQQLIMAVVLLLVILLCLVQLCFKAAMLGSQLLQLIPQLTVVSMCS